MICPYCAKPITPRAKTCNAHRWPPNPRRVCPRCNGRKSIPAQTCQNCRTYRRNLKTLAIIEELSARLNNDQFPPGQQSQLAAKYGVSRQYIGQLANDHVRRPTPG